MLNNIIVKLRFALGFLAIFCLFVFSSASAMAQTAGTGALAGTVTDPTGGSIPNAKLTITSLDNGSVRTVTSAADGSFRVSLLSPGGYKITIEASGFQSIEVPSVTVTVTETAILDRQLQVGTQSQAVTVEANVESVQTTSATLGTVIAARTVTDLPLNTRNFTNLISLSAGTSAGVQNAAVIGKGSQLTSVNGASSTQNNYQQDGASVNNFNSSSGSEGGSTGFIALPNPDAISEFKIQTSNYDASYGRNSGAAVNVVTKSGTNAFHGTAFEFFRNTSLNANDYFRSATPATTPRGVLNQHQYGGALGGPIIKNKLLFFVSFQETVQKNGLSGGAISTAKLPYIGAGDRGTVGSTPPAAWLNDMYAKWCNATGVAGGGVSIQNPNGTLCTNTAANGFAAPAAGTVGVPINPVAIKILQLKFPDGSYYIPANPVANALATTQLNLSVPAIYHEHQPIVNFDYIINQKHTLAARYFYSINPQTAPFAAGASSLLGFPNDRRFTNETGLLKLTSVLTNSFVNELRGSYQRYINNSKGDPTFKRTDVGIMVLGARRLDLPSITITDPGFTIGQFNFGGAFVVTNQFQAADQISWTRGKHTIRAGWESSYYTRYYDFNALQIGTFNTGTFRDFLIGLSGCVPGTAGSGATQCNGGNPGATNGTPSSNIAATTNSVMPGVGGLLSHTPLWTQAAYLQDDFKISQRLTVNLGLRWEYFGFIKENDGKLTNQWRSLEQTAPFPLVTTPCTTTGTAGAPSIIFPTPCPGGTYAGYVIPANYNAAVYGAPPPGVYQNTRTSQTRNGPALNNFAPRVGFAWQPLSSGKLVVRGGGGLFYNMNSADDFFIPSARQSPYALNKVQGSATANFFASLAFPWDQTPVGWVPRWFTATPVAGSSPADWTGSSSNLAFPHLGEDRITPVVYQYNLSVQYEFLPRWVLEVGYVGSHGIHQNTPGNSTDGVRFNPAQLADATHPVNCGFDGNASHCITVSTPNNVALRVPFLGVSNTAYVWGNDEAYKYNSLQATLRKQFSHGFQFQSAYTFSRAFVTTYNGVNNAVYPSVQVYQPNAAYRPHRLVSSYSWDLPFGNPSGFLNKVVTGWSLSGVITLQNGSPLTVTDSQGGKIFGQFMGSNAQLSGNPIVSSGTVTQRLNNYILGGATGGFTAIPNAVVNSSCPVGGTACSGFGNSGNGIISGPGQNSWDMSISKLTKVGGLREGATLQFRAEFFNAFNHPQFNNPATGWTLTSTTFGKITSTAVNPRVMQMALKYSF